MTRRASVHNILAAVDTQRNQAAAEPAAKQADRAGSDPSERAAHVLRRRHDLVLAELARARDRHLAELVDGDDGHRLALQRAKKKKQSRHNTAGNRNRKKNEKIINKKKKKTSSAPS